MTRVSATQNFGGLLLTAARNPLLVVLDVLFGILVISCLIQGAYRAAVYTASFLVMLKLAFVAFSLLFARYQGQQVHHQAATSKRESKNRSNILTIAGVVLVVLGAIPVIALFIRLDFIPGLAAVRVLDYDLLVLLRSTAFEASSGLHLYLLEYALRAFLPIGVFFLLLARSTLFIPAMIAAIFLAVGVMAKIYPIILIAPLIFFCAFSRWYVRCAAFTLLLTLILTAQITTTNPALKLPILVVFDSSTRDYMLAKAEAQTNPGSGQPAPEPPADAAMRAKLSALTGIELKAPAESMQAIDPITERYAMQLAQRTKGAPAGASKLGTAFYKSVEALYIRAVLIPGEVMSQWFETIPSRQPYLGFCGYRVVARLIGCDYVHSPRRVFEIVYADSYVKRGIIGNLNAPGFLMDYANFGLIGVMMSALLLGFIVAIFSTLFAANTAFLAVLMPYFALTTEAPISMILNSGGLGIAALLLFAMHRAIPSNVQAPEP